MDVKVEIIGRTATDQPFEVLGTETVALLGDKVVFTPAMPPAAASKELRVRLSAPASIIFRTKRLADPAPLYSAPFAVWGGAVTQGVPFNGPGSEVIIGHPGMDLTA